MTEDEAVERLNKLTSYESFDDYEYGHGEADRILLEFVPAKVKEAWEKVGKWYA